MKLFSSTVLLYIGLLVSCLSGCQDKPSRLEYSNTLGVQTEPAQNLVISTRAKEVKPGASIKLISDSIIYVNANELVQTELVLEIKEQLGSLDLQLSTTEGLDLIGTLSTQHLNFTSSNPIRVPVKLRTNENGRYYLNLHVTITDGESLTSRSLALIVQAGAENKPSTQFKKSSGEKIIALPAQETISNQ